jgi:hypothetical protein
MRRATSAIPKEFRHRSAAAVAHLDRETLLDPRRWRPRRGGPCAVQGLPAPVNVAVHLPATHATPVGGAGHCPQVTPPQPAHSGFVFGPSPCCTQQRSSWQWSLVMAAGHEQHARIDVASVQSSAVWQKSTSGDGQNGQQNPGPRTGGPCSHSTAGHVIPAQEQTGH